MRDRTNKLLSEKDEKVSVGFRASFPFALQGEEKCPAFLKKSPRPSLAPVRPDQRD